MTKLSIFIHECLTTIDLFSPSVSLLFFLEVVLALEKEMATHSSILAWRIPGTEEPSGLLSMGSHRAGHD